MEPEISHRCPACGASVRARAAFCPQCGRPTQKGERPEISSAVEAAEPPPSQVFRPEREMSIVDAQAEAVQAEIAQAEIAQANESVPPTVPPGIDASPVDAKDDNHRHAAETPVGTVVEDRERIKRHRVAAVARDARDAVEERLGPRVEKLRQASNVVLDEASYDPSLRFVLIAIFIFLVFVVILFISNALG